MRVTAIFMLVITAADAKHHHNSLRKSILESKENFFDNINKDLHILLENIFDCINLAANFTKQSNIQILLTMHYDLSNIANKNFDMFKEVENISRVDIINRTEQIKKLDNLVNKVFIQKHFNAYDQIKGNKQNYRLKEIKTKSRGKIKKLMNISSVFGDSQEFMDFATDFWRKFSKLTKTDYKKSSHLGKRFVSPRRNLKAWEPPSSIENPNFANGTQTRRIYKGTKTKVKTFPFVVSIHIMGEFSCAGCIISRDMIITAASCLQVTYKNKFFEENPKSIYVRLGSDYTLRHGETIPVQRLYFHPRYDPENLRHNLAIVMLERRIRFTKQQKRIRRILWDRSPEPLSPHTDGVLILGWGATKADQHVKMYQKLTVDTLNIYNIDDCREAYSENFVSDEHFCAGFIRTSAGACNGDIGGPGIVGAVLMGIISFGAPLCGAIDTPTVFTKLGYYTPWIESILNPRTERRHNKARAVDARRKQSSSLLHKHNNKSLAHKKKFRVNDDYPEEVKILREILTELIQSDSTVVDELLYGDLYNDFHDIFASTEKVETNQHPLVNLSLFSLDEFSDSSDDSSTTEYVTIPLSTSSTIRPMSTRTSPFLLTYMLTQYETTPMTSPLEATPKTQDNIITKNSDETEEVSGNNEKDNDYTDNYEESAEDDKGMSIEVPSTLGKIHSNEYSTNKGGTTVTYKKEQLIIDTEQELKSTTPYKIYSNNKKYTHSIKEETRETGESSDKKEEDSDVSSDHSHQISDISCESSYKKQHKSDESDESYKKKEKSPDESDESSNKKEQNVNESVEHYDKHKIASDEKHKHKSISAESSDKHVHYSSEIHEYSDYKKEHSSEELHIDFDKTHKYFLDTKQDTTKKEGSIKMDSRSDEHEAAKGSETASYQPLLDIGGLSFGLEVKVPKNEKGKLRKKKRSKITETRSKSNSGHQTTVILIPQGPENPKKPMLKASLVIKYNKKV